LILDRDRAGRCHYFGEDARMGEEMDLCIYLYEWNANDLCDLLLVSN
jgi:hypothetical protein